MSAPNRRNTTLLQLRHSMFKVGCSMFLFKKRGWNNLFQPVFGTTCPKPAKRITALVAVFLLLASPSFAIIDSNENGLSDVWERHYNNGSLFAETFDSQADGDSDGWTNAEEEGAGTNPFVSNPPNGIIRPQISHIPAIYGEENGQPILVSPETVTVSWSVIPGKQYALQLSLDLTAGSWITVGVPFVANITVPTYYFPVADAPKRFWRVKVNDADTDSDGLTDYEEYLITLDADNDGVPDEWERRFSSILLADYGINAPSDPLQFDVNTDYGGFNTSAALVYAGLAGDFDLASTEVVSSPFVEGSMKAVVHYKGGFVGFPQLYPTSPWIETGPVTQYYKKLRTDYHYDYGLEMPLAGSAFGWSEIHGHCIENDNHTWDAVNGWNSSIWKDSQNKTSETWQWYSNNFPETPVNWYLNYYSAFYQDTYGIGVTGDPPALVGSSIVGQWTTNTPTLRIGSGAEHSSGTQAVRPVPTPGYDPTFRVSETFTIEQKLSDPYTTNNMITDAETALQVASFSTLPPVSLRNIVANESKISLTTGKYRLGWTLPTNVPVYPGNNQVKAVFLWQEVTDPEPIAPGSGSGRMIKWKHVMVNATPGNLAHTLWHDLPPPQNDGITWIRPVTPHGSVTLPAAILVNKDDDDANGQEDSKQTSFTLGTENDLIALNFQANAPGPDEKAMVYKLEATGAGKVRLWQAFPNQQPQLVGLPYKLQTRDYAGSTEIRPTYYLEATRSGSMSLNLNAEVLGQKLALVAVAEFESLDVTIDFAAGMKGVIGDIIPSNFPSSKAVHFVTTKSASPTDVVALTASGVSAAAITPHHSGQLVEWLGAFPSAGTPANGNVSRTSTGKFPVAVRVIASGQTTAPTNVWVTWVEKQILDAPAITTIGDLNALEYHIKGKVAFTFDFEPTSMFDLTADIPDLSTPWDSLSLEVAGQFHPWKITEPLSDGALCNYDVSRKVRVKFETSNLQALAGEMKPSVLSFPAGLIGNDDSDWRPQVPPYNKVFAVGPSYVQGEHAHSRDGDSPQYVLPHAKGADGDTFKMHADFIEFVRIRIGSKAYLASENFESKLTFAFKKENGKWTDDSSTYTPGLSSHF